MATPVKFYAVDIARRHPQYLSCSTDIKYAKLASEIHAAFQKDLGFLEEEHHIKNACITLALYFEDIHSETRQFEAFTRIYQRMYGRYLPFYESKTAEDPTAELDATCFILWHAMNVEREGNILNPMNEGLRDIAGRLLDLWNSRKDTMPKNEDLRDYLFCEETLNVAFEVRNVLKWIMFQSMLGQWEKNPAIGNDPFGVENMIGDVASESLLTHTIQSVAVFNTQAWPLSLKPSQIYAEMIRIDMDDEEDEMALQIEELQGTVFGVFANNGPDKDYICVTDHDDEVHKVRKDSFAPNTPKSDYKKNTLIGALFCYRGEWYVNGASSLMDLEQSAVERFNEMMRNCLEASAQVDQYDDYVRMHQGERLYFIKNGAGLKKFLTKELNTEPKGFLLPYCSMDEPMMLFLGVGNPLSVSLEYEGVHHPNNPYYDKNQAIQRSLFYMGDPKAFTQEQLMYLIEKDLFDEFSLNDILGYEYGRKTMQDNMEFLSRYMRRDIKTDAVYRRRDQEKSVQRDKETADKRLHSKTSEENFIETLNDLESFRSRANKEWEVLYCNSLETHILDVNNDKEFVIETRMLYDAFLNLDSAEIQVANLVPYVGRKNAPAASAVLDAAFGKSRTRNMFIKSIRKMLGGMGLE